MTLGGGRHDKGVPYAQVHSSTGTEDDAAMHRSWFVDTSLGFRLEQLSAVQCVGHAGHVFDDCFVSLSSRLGTVPSSEHHKIGH